MFVGYQIISIKKEKSLCLIYAQNLYGKCRSRFDIPRARAHRHGVCATGNSPLLSHHIPKAHITTAQVDGDICARTRGNADFLKPTQDSRGLVSLLGETKVQLRNLHTVHSTRVGDARRDADNVVPQIGVAANSERARRVA